jgi:hypothetical protein
MNTLVKTTIYREQSWTTHIAEGGFTSDDLINAYLLGIQDHAKQAKKDIEKRFEKNLNKAQSIGAEFIDSMTGKGFDIKYASLKFNTIDSFKVIIFVAKKLFLSDKVLEFYKHMASFLKDVNNDNFYISFNIMPEDNRINTKRMLADGYIFSYGEHK